MTLLVCSIIANFVITIKESMNLNVQCNDNRDQSANIEPRIEEPETTATGGCFRYFLSSVLSTLHLTVSFN